LNIHWYWVFNRIEEPAEDVNPEILESLKGIGDTVEVRRHAHPFPHGSRSRLIHSSRCRKSGTIPILELVEIKWVSVIRQEFLD
jgi:hypothetical protein